MPTSTTTTAPCNGAAAPRALVPGIYRGGSAAEFGLWRLRADGVWLFCVPVAGAVWKRAGDQDPGDSLILLVDETRI
ncbi:hypothetical protein SAMN06295974_3777 [Plantibacter flavus]|uniref:Uncharacterized protein n=1 Tax=Plantibacter flavus TaxID=150123 RepID=A0A3N2BLD5_9MICO|nr:hypothetical protein [Plantibacter flavus]ROR76075.1 hypothetical protein EDD42_4028 [Plantibacter flavus]SMG48877.1 hypothetical protein SAMN06295974_3777 [Plantibacter flavus]